jgi:hypothetical protein
MLFAEDLDDCVIAYELCGLERLRVVKEPSCWPPEGMREELPGRVANCLNIKGQDLVGESAAVSLLRQREGSCLDIATCAAHVKHLAMHRGDAVRHLSEDSDITRVDGQGEHTPGRPRLGFFIKSRLALRWVSTSCSPRNATGCEYQQSTTVSHA